MSEESFEQLMKEMEEQQKIIPKSVSAARGMYGNRTYDAEVTFMGMHYVVSTGHKSREVAIEAANRETEHVRKILISHGRDYLKKFPFAKP